MFVLAALLLSSPLWAEAPPTLSLQETLRLVLANNPDQNTAELSEEIAAIEAQRARLDRFSAQITAGASSNAGVIKPWSEDLYSTENADWDTRASLSVPLYAGGSIQANIDQADANAQISTIDRQLTERSLVRAAYTAYWNIKGYELQIAASQEGLDLTQQALEIIQAKANAGLAAGIDVNRSKVDLYAQQESLVAQKSALYRAEQELIRLLNLPGEHLILSDAPPAITPPAFALPDDPTQERPEMARKSIEALQADAAIRAAQAGVLPTISLSATAGVGSTATGSSLGGDLTAFDSADLRPTLDASVGVQLSWNPFDLFQTRDRVAQARLSAQQVSARTESQKLALTAEIRQAAATLEQLRQRAPLVEAQVALARDNLQIVQGLYAQGSATILDLFNAQASFRQARTAGASLQVDLVLATYDLHWLLGDDLTGAIQ